MLIKAGTLVSFAWGVYSDKVWEGPFRALKDFDQRAVVDACRDAWVPEYDGDDDGPRAEEFVAFLTAQGYIEDPANCVEWNLAEWSRDLEPMIDGKRLPKRRAHGNYDAED